MENWNAQLITENDERYDITICSGEKEPEAFMYNKGKGKVKLNSTDILARKAIWRIVSIPAKGNWGNKTCVTISDPEVVKVISEALANAFRKSKIYLNIDARAKNKTNAPICNIDFSSAIFKQCFRDAYEKFVKEPLKLNEYYIVKRIENAICHSPSFFDFASSFAPKDADFSNPVSVAIRYDFMCEAITSMLADILPELLKAQQAKFSAITELTKEHEVFENADAASKAEESYRVVINEYGRYTPDLLYAARVEDATKKIFMIENSLACITKNLRVV